MTKINKIKTIVSRVITAKTLIPCLAMTFSSGNIAFSQEKVAKEKVNLINNNYGLKQTPYFLRNTSETIDSNLLAEQPVAKFMRLQNLTVEIDPNKDYLALKIKCESVNTSGKTIKSYLCPSIRKLEAGGFQAMIYSANIILDEYGAIDEKRTLTEAASGTTALSIGRIKSDDKFNFESSTDISKLPAGKYVAVMTYTIHDENGHYVIDRLTKEFLIE